MDRILKIPIENELDMSLAYRKSKDAAKLLNLSISSQTTFATAVSEISREIIDKATDGLLELNISAAEEKYSLVAKFTYLEVLTLDRSEGIMYASKLVPHFDKHKIGDMHTLNLSVKIPSFVRIDREKVRNVRFYFESVEEKSPYELLLEKNYELSEINERTELELHTANYIINQKNEFLSVASHELKTPLTILKGLTQLALRSSERQDVAPFLVKINTQVQKLQDLITRLLDISKSETDKLDYNFEQLELNNFLTDLEILLKNLVPAHNFELITEDVPVFINCDRLRLEQVINNLIGNAAKYSSENTTIVLTVKTTENGYVNLSVKDQGIGMNKNDLEKVFEKFYRISEVKSQVAGLGIGLYVSSRIVNDHQGKIWAESSIGEGSIFHISLPYISYFTEKAHI
ncbi:sensor histidine kinase [Sphingobacterium sp.]|uniref:ATP-binding protein n=1 Tax=Sphingobacterium sp. TaxID=341027 RepID=UPI00289A4743|nr:sensor histidine kinase [Sphingobacterium sp.]